MPKRKRKRNERRVRGRLLIWLHRSVTRLECCRTRQICPAAGAHRHADHASRCRVARQRSNRSREGRVRSAKLSGLPIRVVEYGKEQTSLRAATTGHASRAPVLKRRRGPNATAPSPAPAVRSADMATCSVRAGRGSRDAAAYSFVAWAGTKGRASAGVAIVVAAGLPSCDSAPRATPILATG